MHRGAWLHGVFNRNNGGISKGFVLANNNNIM